MNEVQVSLDEVGRVQLRRASGDEGVYTLETTEALRAFFQAERDEALGRWRDPENPNMVVYPLDDGEVRVLDERDRTALRWSRAQAEDDEYSLGFGFATAGRYFEAHPKPKPWDAARPDEIWALTINNNREEVFRCGENGLYRLKTGNPIGSLLSHSAITAGRRIWPEGEASE